MVEHVAQEQLLKDVPPDKLKFDLTFQRSCSDRHAYAFCMSTGGIGRSKFKLDRTNLALYWQYDSTSEKVISSPANRFHQR